MYSYCYVGLNCQNWWLEISQQTIRKLHDFLCEEIQGVALNAILYEWSKKTARKNTGCVNLNLNNLSK